MMFVTSSLFQLHVLFREPYFTYNMGIRSHVWRLRAQLYAFGKLCTLIDRHINPLNKRTSHKELRSFKILQVGAITNLQFWCMSAMACYVERSLFIVHACSIRSPLCANLFMRFLLVFIKDSNVDTRDSKRWQFCRPWIWCWCSWKIEKLKSF